MHTYFSKNAKMQRCKDFSVNFEAFDVFFVIMHTKQKKES
jgi:hypothetical protein